MKEFSRRDEVLEMKKCECPEEGLQSTLVVAQNEYRYVADIEESYDDLPQSDATWETSIRCFSISL